MISDFVVLMAGQYGIDDGGLSNRLDDHADEMIAVFVKKGRDGK